MEGKLYVVATPIGNLKDITFRAVEILKEVDFVVAENRARAMKLLSHLGIKKQMVTINGYNEERREKGIVQYLLKGKSGALISAAGMPCISDPGNFVVKAAHEAGIEVQAIPGASASIGAFAISGLAFDKFLFYGFLPQKKGKKKKIFRQFSSFPYPMIFFESPRRLLETLRCIQEECGDRTVVICKELTKLHERVIRGNTAEVITSIGEDELKGEYTLILDGNTEWSHGTEKQEAASRPERIAFERP
jgi:16S rRNA (cytidine1402-2'-O)-methyltransferase